ncbi:MAG: Ig-like domain-containing protein [Coriobacteriia bacterium]|nr:Ig-like domain-containing protein [Coriobacteriia bacterium]
MKTLPRLIVLVALVVAALAATSSVAFGASRLVFSDEFNGPLSTATWANDTPWNTHYTTGELEYYDPANCTFANGMMTLKTETRANNGYAYSSGIVTSLPHTKFTYGYFEIRAKLPGGPGIWPAFWLTNDSTLEIDALEMLGSDSHRIYGTLHEHNAQIYQGIKDGPDYSAGFHTYGVDWQPDHVKWYIDGVEYASYNHAVPADPMWITLNTAVGGPWGGVPTSATHLPVNFDVDYIRVYDTMPTANVAPVANADSYATAYATAKSVSAPGVLGNDTDANGDKLTASVVTQPTNGTLTMAADGSFKYTPNAGFSGIDSFTYQVSDGLAASAPAQVLIGVAGSDVRGPFAMGDSYAVGVNTTLNVGTDNGLLANDIDTMGRSMTALVAVQPTHGTLALSDDGSFAYTPASGYSGVDTFTYIAADGSAVSDPTGVSVTVVQPKTIATMPVVRLKSRARRTYNVGGAVRFAAKPKSKVVVSLQMQRYLRGAWHAYKTPKMTNPAANYKTVVKLRRGTFRVRASVSVGGAKAATSVWAKSFRVR